MAIRTAIIMMTGMELWIIMTEKSLWEVSAKSYVLSVRKEQVYDS